MINKTKNYIQFIFSMFIMGLGIVFITKSNLGTSAISSLPFVFSKVFNLSFGSFTVILNFIYVFIQIIFQKKDFNKEQYLQLFVGPLLGFFIDFWMNTFISLNPNIYVMKMNILFLGCFILGVGVYIQLAANVVNNPMEGVIKLISSKLDSDFFATKITFDVMLVILSIAVSYLALGKIVGVREGTVISAFLVGYVIKLLNYLEVRFNNKEIR